MNEAVLLLFLIDFAFIGTLPLTFFKRSGSFNLLWWLTASPFYLCVLVLVTSYLDIAPALISDTFFRSGGLELASMAFAVASIALIALTIGTHRVRIALWHQQGDAPQHIVTYGAYRYVRHPFYAAFLLALAGAFLFNPQPGTLFTLVFGFVLLNTTAAREERRLQDSEFGAEYTAYTRRTGRFIPMPWRKPA